MSDERSKGMRVSEWKNPEAGGVPPPGGVGRVPEGAPDPPGRLKPVPPGRTQGGTSGTAGTAGSAGSAGSEERVRADAPSASRVSGAPAEEEESIKLPVDPFRLLGGLLLRWKWIVLGGLLGLGLGVAIGFQRFETRHVATVQLIEQELPGVFRAGEMGEAFRPRELSSGTLIGAALSPQVLQRVAEKSDPPVSRGLLRRSVEISEGRDTEFVYLTLSGYHTAEATARMANLWAEEFISFTRELQTEDSRGMGQFLEKQIANSEREIAAIGERILAFSKDENIVDPDKQVDAVLREIGELELKYETARINLQTIDYKVEGLEAELRRQSPIAESIRQVESELEELRARYTDQNPLVLEKVEKLDSLEAELRKTMESRDIDNSEFTGTFLGNTIYLDILNLTNERAALVEEMQELEILKANARERLEALPEKAAELARLQERKQALQLTRNLLASRQREARLYEENAPGLYEIFAAARPEEVETRGKAFKVAAFGVAGMVAMAGLAFLLALGAELADPVLRTSWEAGNAFDAPVLAAFLRDSRDIDDGRPPPASLLWNRWIGATPDVSSPRLLWACRDTAGEEVLWRELLSRGGGLFRTLLVVDGAMNPGHLAQWVAEAPENVTYEHIPVGGMPLPEIRGVAGRLAGRSREGDEVWIRLEGAVEDPAASLARRCEPAVFIVPVEDAPGRFWKLQAENYRAAMGREPQGVVVLGETPWYRRAK